MARETDENIPFSSVSSQYLHANSTSHTWAFSAIAMLIDNAYDPDVGAKQIWIDWTKIKGFDCLTFTDNGAGMDFDKMHKMLSFGFSDKQAFDGRAPVGLYGNGFKSGSMFLGKDAIVFSKNIDSMTVGLLSQTYLAAIQVKNVVVPIVTFTKNEENKFSAIPQHRGSLKAVLEHSLFQTEEQLLRELEIIKGFAGTRIIIWNLRSTTSGQIEFEFKEDIKDIQIPYVDSTDEQRRPIRRPAWVAEFEFSLRAYCSILYLNPWMQILIRGKKVKTQLVEKSLAHTDHDKYKLKFLKESVSVTFGYRTNKGGPYGVLMYYKNRLIRPYMHLGCQLKANAKGVGVIGVIECNFLKPTHNKQEFADSEEYRKIKHSIGVKLEEYWEEMRHKRKENPSSTESTDNTDGAVPDQVWIQCNDCLKWRKLADGIDPESLPDVWVCPMNNNPKFRRCWIEEPEDSNEKKYEKNYKKQQKKKQKVQKKKGRQNSEDSDSTPKTSATPSKRYDTRQRRGDAPTSLTSSSSSSPLSFSDHLPSFDTVLSTYPAGSGYPVTAIPSSREKKKQKLQKKKGQQDSEDSEPTPNTSATLLKLNDTRQRTGDSQTSLSSSSSTPLSFSGDDPSFDTVLSTYTVPENPSSRQKRKLITQENKEGKRAKMIGHQNDTSEAVASTAASALRLPTSPVTATLDKNSMQVQTATLEGDQCSEQVETVKQERDQHSEQVEAVTRERDQYREQMETVTQERDQYREQVKTVIRERDRYRNQVKTVTQERNHYREEVEAITEEREQYREQMETVTQERDQYREQVKTVTQERDQYREQMETVTQERDQYREQVKAVIRARDRYRNQVKTVTQERNQYREQVEAVTEERDQYREQMETITQERDQYREQVKTVTQERDQSREQVKTITQERDQYKTKAFQPTMQMLDLQKQI